MIENFWLGPASIKRVGHSFPLSGPSSAFIDLGHLASLCRRNWPLFLIAQLSLLISRKSWLVVHVSLPTSGFLDAQPAFPEQGSPPSPVIHWSEVVLLKREMTIKEVSTGSDFRLPSRCPTLRCHSRSVTIGLTRGCPSGAGDAYVLQPVKNSASQCILEPCQSLIRLSIPLALALPLLRLDVFEVGGIRASVMTSHSLSHMNLDTRLLLLALLRSQLPQSSQWL